jgi:hypothetical protein
MPQMYIVGAFNRFGEGHQGVCAKQQGRSFQGVGFRVCGCRLGDT